MNILHLFSVKKRRPSIHWHGWKKTWANQKQACLAQNLQWQLQTYWSVHDPLMTYKPNCSTCLDLIVLNSSRMFLDIGRKLLIHTILTRRCVVLYFYTYFFSILCHKHCTMAKTEIIYPKNMGASVAMNFT